MPEQFASLQVHEFNALLNGYEQRRREREMECAYFVSWLLQPYASQEHPITPDIILAPLHPELQKDIVKDREDFFKTFGIAVPRKKEGT